jgi:hypothetical protein
MRLQGRAEAGYSPLWCQNSYNQQSSRCPCSRAAMAIMRLSCYTYPARSGHALLRHQYPGLSLPSQIPQDGSRIETSITIFAQACEEIHLPEEAGVRKTLDEAEGTRLPVGRAHLTRSIPIIDSRVHRSLEKPHSANEKNLVGLWLEQRLCQALGKLLSRPCSFWLEFGCTFSVALEGFGQSTNFPNGCSSVTNEKLTMTANRATSAQTKREAISGLVWFGG